MILLHLLVRMLRWEDLILNWVFQVGVLLVWSSSIHFFFFFLGSEIYQSLSYTFYEIRIIIYIGLFKLVWQHLIKLIKIDSLLWFVENYKSSFNLMCLLLCIFFFLPDNFLVTPTHQVGSLWLALMYNLSLPGEFLFFKHLYL